MGILGVRLLCLEVRSQCPGQRNRNWHRFASRSGFSDFGAGKLITERVIIHSRAQRTRIRYT